VKCISNYTFYFFNVDKGKEGMMCVTGMKKGKKEWRHKIGGI
jgi:hypothetical protein